MSEVNAGKIQGARSEAYQEERYASDEQQRRLPEFASPRRGSQKMNAFCVAPPHGNALLLPLRRPPE
ncbi:MAG: hypothetical protein HYW78_02290 [Parcubacteria group bacterium]|nr:hypothetical protein [Parcubacteria group bacterium]